MKYLEYDIKNMAITRTPTDKTPLISGAVGYFGLHFKNEIPYYVGVLIPTNDRWRTLESVKKAKRKDRVRPVSEMLLMMFRSCARERKEMG